MQGSLAHFALITGTLGRGVNLLVPLLIGSFAMLAPFIEPKTQNITLFTTPLYWDPMEHGLSSQQRHHYP